MSRVFRDSKITGQILFIKKIVTARQSVPCRQPVGLLPEARRPGTMPSTPCSRSCNTWGLGGNSRRASPGHGCAFVSCLHLLLYVLSDPRRQGVLKRRVFGQLLCAFRQQLLRDGDTDTLRPVGQLLTGQAQCLLCIQRRQPAVCLCLPQRLGLCFFQQDFRVVSQHSHHDLLAVR